MKIGRNNYELFFIDYLDGTLRDGQITELEDFLLLNPDLREELEGMEKIGLIPEKLMLPDKDILRKIDTDTTLSEDNFDDFCAAYIEGDLNDEKISALESYIVNHPEHKPDLELYRQTTLLPNSSIVYPSKNKLKKNSPAGTRVILYSVLSAAAAIVLLMIIFRGIDSPDNIPIPLTGDPDHPESEMIKTEKVPIDILADQHNEKPGILPSATEKIAKPKIKTTIQSQNDNHVKEDLHLAESFTSENFEIRDISLAGLYLPAVEPIRAQPEVIKGFAIPDESTFVIPSLTDPDYLSLPDVALNFINNKVLRLDEPIDETSSRLSLWEVADASIKGINRLTGSDMKLDKQSGVNGELKAISFDAGIIGFSRSIK